VLYERRRCGSRMQELAAVEKKMGEDFRFNHRLESACEEDANVLCSKVCDGTLEFRPCGGKVLHCLIENQSQVKSRACKKEVSYYIKMEVCCGSRRLCLPVCPAHCLKQGLAVRLRIDVDSEWGLGGE